MFTRSFTNVTGEAKTAQFKYKIPFSNHWWSLNSGQIEFLLSSGHFRGDFFTWHFDPSCGASRRRQCPSFNLEKNCLRLHREFFIRERNRESKRKRKGRGDHSWETAPTHASKFKRRKWVCNAKTPYQQYHCRGDKCKKDVRRYCTCDIGYLAMPILPHYSCRIIGVIGFNYLDLPIFEDSLALYFSKKPTFKVPFLVQSLRIAV